jgi:glycosyltransferase involved in cell wall biosynthesis
VSKIIVYTCAYNAEKTIRRTVDSVLSQSLGDFIYYLIDNGSTDSTSDIVRSYAETDGRIKALANKENKAELVEIQNYFKSVNPEAVEARG